MLVVGALIMSITLLMLFMWAGDRSLRRLDRRRATLEAIRDELAGYDARRPLLTEREDRVIVVRDGARLSVALVIRDDGELGATCTELELALPGLPLSFDVRPQTRSMRALRERGLVLDVATGDAEFDGAFLIEGAPRDLVLIALDAGTRARLRELGAALAYHPARGLRLEVPGWAEPSTIVTLADAVIALAARLAEVVPAFERTQSSDGGAPYRGDHGGAGSRRAAAERAELDAIRHRRAIGLLAGAGLTSAALIGLGVVLAGVLLIVALG